MKSKNAIIIVKRKKNNKVETSFRNINFLNKDSTVILRIRLTQLIVIQNTILEIDLKGITFIDNSVIDTLNLVSRLGKRYNSRVILTNVGEKLLELIRLVKEHSVLDIREIKAETKTMKAA